MARVLAAACVEEVFVAAAVGRKSGAAAAVGASPLLLLPTPLLAPLAARATAKAARRSIVW
jgi:hypothetical protein